MAQGAYVGRRRAYGSFAADVSAMVDRTEQKMLDVMRASLNDLVVNMQTPVAKGGRMRVDTGWLRASGRASLEGMPSGQGARPSDAPVGQYTGVYDNFDGSALNAVLLDMEFGDTFYWGWVANYAQYRELYDGFMEASIQHWPRYVAFAIDTVNKGSR